MVRVLQEAVASLPGEGLDSFDTHSHLIGHDPYLNHNHKESSSGERSPPDRLNEHSRDLDDTGALPDTLSPHALSWGSSLNGRLKITSPGQAEDSESVAEGPPVIPSPQASGIRTLSALPPSGPTSPSGLNAGGACKRYARVLSASEAAQRLAQPQAQVSASRGLSPAATPPPVAAPSTDLGMVRLTSIAGPPLRHELVPQSRYLQQPLLPAAFPGSPSPVPTGGSVTSIATVVPVGSGLPPNLVVQPLQRLVSGSVVMGQSPRPPVTTVQLPPGVQAIAAA